MIRKAHFRIRIIAACVALMCACAGMRGETLSLAWDPPLTYADGSPLTALSGFRIYHGYASGAYSDYMDVAGSSPNADVAGLEAGTNHYFSVTAVSATGGESAFSGELSIYLPPSVVLSTNTISIQEGGSVSVLERLSGAPKGATTVEVSRVAGGDRFVGVISGASRVFSTANWANNQTVILAAIYDPVRTNRLAVFRCAGKGVSSAEVSVTTIGQAVAPTELADASDSDQNGLPDSWEIRNFGGVGMQGAAPGDDLDGDGCSNEQEYIAGTDPADALSAPLMEIHSGGGPVSVAIQAIQATGTGYQGKTRYYTFEQCTNLTQGGWTTIPDYSLLPAQNQVISNSPPPIISGASAIFYRARIDLQ